MVATMFLALWWATTTTTTTTSMFMYSVEDWFCIPYLNVHQTFTVFVPNAGL